MTISIDLPPELEARLKSQAEKSGLAPREYILRFLEDKLPLDSDMEHQREVNQQALALLASWELRDATNDPTEIARRNKDFEEFRTAINETREMAGSRKIYP